MNRKFKGSEWNPNNWLSAIYIKTKKTKKGKTKKTKQTKTANEWIDYFLLHQNYTLITWSKLFATEGES